MLVEIGDPGGVKCLGKDSPDRVALLQCLRSKPTTWNRSSQLRQPSLPGTADYHYYLTVCFPQVGHPVLDYLADLLTDGEKEGREGFAILDVNFAGILRDDSSLKVEPR